MLVSTFDTFVQETDLSVGKARETRLDIATYGLAAEIGSVVSAIKKRLLAEGGPEDWCVANDEIIEELGDVIWYCFSLARITNDGKPLNIFARDIANIKRELSASDDRANRLRSALDPSKREAFLKAAATFPKKTKVMEFEDYQSAAFLTARTEHRTLVDVCLALLWQLSAQLFRRKLPEIEQELNKALADKDPNDTLGEIAWHVSALASIYKLKLSDIAQRNIEKVSFRLDRRHPTPLHDEDHLPLTQRFPRHFEIAFVSFAEQRCRMYLNGRRLGDDLTDNSHEEDGYRYHDIMHLANVAKLGWSPVLRGLMGIKRKAIARTDEIEDGARAKIVEELVIKAIHSEGQKLAANRGPVPQGQPVHMFADPDDVTFRLLKFVRDLVVGLEAHNNRYWEWEDAIREGYEIFYRLRCEGQGTVTVDLDARSISFRPEVCVDLEGKLTGLGSACLDAAMVQRDSRLQKEVADAMAAGMEEAQAMRVVVRKMAVLDSIGIRELTADALTSLQVTEVGDAGISVKASGATQRVLWDRKVVTFRTTVSTTSSRAYHCTAIAVTDD